MEQIYSEDSCRHDVSALSQSDSGYPDGLVQSKVRAV